MIARLEDLFCPAVTIPGPLIPNDLDPMKFVADAAFHVACLARHPLGPAAIDRLETLLAKTRNPVCAHCGGAMPPPRRGRVFRLS